MNQSVMTNVSNAQFPLIPLRDVVVFPQIGQALIISRPKSIAALERALLQDDRRIVVVAQKVLNAKILANQTFIKSGHWLMSCKCSNVRMAQ